jgi:ech hydrogenase subunit D
MPERKMTETEKIITIELHDLLAKVSELKQGGWRLVQIGCALLEGFQLDYSFGRDYDFINLRINIPSLDIEIPSVSTLYRSAFIYENEMHDLFGVKVNGISIDYRGNFYQTAVKTPFAVDKPTQEEERVP